MTEDEERRVGALLYQHHLECKAFTARIAELETERDALRRELNIERAHRDALLACTMPEDTAQ